MTPEREAEIRRDAYGFGSRSPSKFLREVLAALDAERRETARLRANEAKINAAMDVLLQGYSESMDVSQGSLLRQGGNR